MRVQRCIAVGKLVFLFCLLYIIQNFLRHLSAAVFDGRFSHVQNVVVVVYIYIYSIGIYAMYIETPPACIILSR